jgi:hypothetical protein
MHPVQYHYVVWAEVHDGKTVWNVDIEGYGLLFDGSVYDPNATLGDEWRTLNEDEQGLDNRLYAELQDRLKIGEGD